MYRPILDDGVGGTYQTFAQDIDKATFAVARYPAGQVAVCAWSKVGPMRSWNLVEQSVIEQCERYRLSHMSKYEKESRRAKFMPATMRFCPVVNKARYQPLLAILLLLPLSVSSGELDRRANGILDV